jgi:NitT/TauT family transport system ATP-binding protein
MQAARTDDRFDAIADGSYGVDISISGLTKRFGSSFLYKDFSVDIPGNRITCIFGPNGCGKSTLLNMIAGLIPIESGQILFGGQPWESAKIGYVFQNYRDALFPWLRAIDNVKYPLTRAGLSRTQCRVRTEELIHQFNVKFDLNRYPYELSGGQQQLVSIMRALATKPNILFLDEPFSALDYEATLSIRDKLQDVFMATGVTIVMISHDLEEAVYLADHIVLLTKRPTSVAEVITFGASRPRVPETLSDPDFVRVKGHSLDVFRREANR